MVIHSTKYPIIKKRVILLSILVGIVAGFGAIIFRFLLEVSTQFFLHYLAGYKPPSPAGEHSFFEIFKPRPFQRILLLVVPAIGGLISGIIIYTFAPEAEGHGTDAVIDAYHRKKGQVRKRVPVVKTIASAITIGSGGSAGREGPIAQIGSGFGSYIAKRFKTSSREREILTLVGAAAGIGSIFKAPFGGSIFGIEVLYKEDYEVDAFIPIIIATFIGYSIYSLVAGWQPIFSAPKYIFRPFQLPFYALLGVICGLLARFYVWVFYSTRDFFKGLKLKDHFKPMLGGFATGIIAFFVPEALGVGYGFLQKAINGELLLEIMIAIAIAKIFATAFSIGSGGSGGVFAPSIVIGGMLGGAVGVLLSNLFPNLGFQIGIFVLIGMVAFFSGAAKVPLASIIMVAEMTWDYGILIPAILAAATSYFVAGDATIYESQVRNKAESPVHVSDFFFVTLSRFKVKEAMTVDVKCVEPDYTLEEVERLASKYKFTLFPVIDKDKRFLGYITIKEVIDTPYELRGGKRVKELMHKMDSTVSPEDDLATALRYMIENNITKLPVTDPKTNKVIGLITMRDISKVVYYKGLDLIK